MQRILQISTFLVLALLVGITGIFSVAYAATTDNTTGNSQTTYGSSGIIPYCSKDGVEVPCEKFEDIIITINNLVNLAIKLALMFSVVIIAYAGFIYMTAEGSPNKISEAHKMFQSVAIGVAVIMLAWTIVHFIMVSLVTPEVRNLITF